MPEVLREDPKARPLREWRAARLFTIRDLARAAGVSPRTVDRLEAGEKSPRLATVRRIAAALRVDPQRVVEFQATVLALDDRETARHLERMGYPPLLAQRAGQRRGPSTPSDA